MSILLDPASLSKFTQSPTQFIFEIEESAFDRELIITIVGDSGVGKTEFVTRYVDRAQSSPTTASVGVTTKHKVVDVGPLRAKLRVLDTAGRDQFRDFTTTTFKDAHVVVIIFSVDSRASFERYDQRTIRRGAKWARGAISLRNHWLAVQSSVLASRNG